MMKYNSEKEIYLDVIYWLNTYLQHKYPRGIIKSYDTSRENLCEFIRRHKLSKYFSESETYVVKIDVTGVVQYNEKCFLAFVECKLNSINLKDVSQIISYSKVVRPELAFILSLGGISFLVNLFLKIFKRHDILEYIPQHRIKVAKWDIQRKEIDVSSLLPPGEFV